jgi:F-type H+-transporting ATPase subunit alpha
VVAIFLGTGGHLDSVPVEDVSRFESEFLDHIRASEEGILSEIRESQKLGEEGENKLTEAVNEFKKGFGATGGGSVVPDEHVDALDEDKVAKESVQVHKPAPPEQKK